MHGIHPPAFARGLLPVDVETYEKKIYGKVRR
jgi:hypothetical protein